MSCCVGGGGQPYDLTKRINVQEKRLINCKAVDVNQLMPLKYKWAWEHYLNGCANNWLPSEVPMQRDVELWKSNRLSDEERLVIMRNLGFFATGESLVGNNIVLAIFKFVTNAEARQYLLRQAYEEAVHTHAFLYIVESLGLDEREVFNMYHEVNSISNKDQFEMALTEDILRSDFNTESVENIQKFVKNLVGFYVIMEGIFFYSGFVMILSFHRQNKMTGIGEQFQYILRDETIHLNFGIDLINGIKEENPEIWTVDFQKEIEAMIDQAVLLEYAYAKDCLPRGILGLNSALFKDYVEYIADRRLERIGFKAKYGSKNPFPWMSEVMDLVKEKNFFETRVTEYQSGAVLNW
ncbi:ribonucleotide-diphosphate reductase subunit beta [Candidatus Methylacidiphilum fumarolicum]|jgi:ribonucleoside-diphosphate reductase beta chain|uniref:Ribonucleoside-diphosphate reductase subunit beta n=2 Tax=Candidatus Methylacidiphilum fumarolicum TaxID=591154 RepID=I0JWF7_METFB|nr:MULTISPECIES: ribonucleotide-diphosphate reductase subunit beta [Methylacidiphilum (ex Ratnadevi et al. 2023)]MBW6415610.1 ribonucleotide-diphosphate reductase subunit beta [Candidatus Methylacidiphilum fumarolicum]TFE66625.1 ribonucleoside-diphosphate reductase [Candidatus Methylacidiphilum fumarolicum]TFE66751.1 ribonucleoside-diphosphate reductase [Methylacidiphilum sp. Yel]TFE73383.1 ribonucleotide-diphosphate reductase subunit beta [Candidatus Methylacidiphilum fumarolicum]TFE75419.1 r